MDLQYDFAFDSWYLQSCSVFMSNSNYYPFDTVSSTALFTHAGVTPTTDDQIREKVLNFVKDKVSFFLRVVPIFMVLKTAMRDYFC